MTDPATNLLFALATREVSYDLGDVVASHAWLEGDAVHVATVEREGGELVRRQHVVAFDASAPYDLRIKAERVTCCAECQGDVYFGHRSPGVEWDEDRWGKPYAGGCETCVEALEHEREHRECLAEDAGHAARKYGRVA